MIANQNDIDVYINTNGSSPEEYTNIIQRSKIAISLPSAGYDTFSYWEIPYYGTCLLSKNLPIEIENNSKNGYSALFFNNEKNMTETILKALKGVHYEEIAKNGYLTFRTHRTDLHIAERLIKLITENF